MHSHTTTRSNCLWRSTSFLIAVAIAAYSAHAQSFDCAKARTTIERAICTDRSLADLDNILARTLGESLSRVPERQKTLVRDERQWLAYRNQECPQPATGPDSPLVNCLSRVYRDRIDQLRSISPVSGSYSDACAIVRDDYQSRLENPTRPARPTYETLTSPWDGNPGSPPPPQNFVAHLVPIDPDGDPPVITVHDALIDGRRASFVAVTSSHDCSAVTNYEVWSPDLRQYRGSIADALGTEPIDTGPHSYISVKGRKVLLFWDRHGGSEEIDVLRFRRDLAPILACRVVLEPQRPEKLLSASDPQLCAAVQRGDVENVALENVDEESVQRWELPEPPTGFTFAESVVVYAQGVIDIANDKNPRRIAMLRSSGIGGAGCGFGNLAWEWPVVTNGYGSPDLDSPINRDAIKAGNQVSHLIRYHGRIYVDGHASPNEHGPHTVAAVSKAGVQKMCEFEPFQYSVRQLKAE